MLLNRKQDQTNGKKHKDLSPLKHMGMMGACCLLPLVIVGILSLFQMNNAGTSRLIAGLFSLICPIMMSIMMIGMFRNGKDHTCYSDGKKDE